MRRAAVLGHPVSHSLSPALHRAAYAALGLDWTYEAVDVRAGDLASFLAGLDPSWVGLSLTMPLKRTVRPLLDEVSALAASTGVVNTVTFGGGRSRGENTDVHGLVEALRGCGARTAAVLGGGATAVSAVAALRELGCAEPVMYVRSPQRAAGAGVAVLPLSDASWAQAAVVVSTLPAGAADSLAVHGPVTGTLLDAAYDPWPSALAHAWTAAGGSVVDGVQMLLHQAAEQVRLMTGSAPPVEAMRAALPARVVIGSGSP